MPICQVKESLCTNFLNDVTFPKTLLISSVFSTSFLGLGISIILFVVSLNQGNWLLLVEVDNKICIANIANYLIFGTPFLRRQLSMAFH